jgi:hypothetical protein
MVGRSHGGATRQEDTMQSLTRPLAATLFAAACLVSGTVANAQAPAQAPAPTAPAPATPSPSISDQKLDAPAAALERVAKVQQDYEQRIARAPDNDKDRLVSEGNNALVQAVTDQGLTVEEYNSILRVAQNDAEIRGKIFQRLDRSMK